MSPKNVNRTWHIQPVLLVALVGLIALLWWQHYAIQDWIKLRGYAAPAGVIQLANDDEMLPYTRHLFYLNKPQLPTTIATFRTGCPENEDTVVLGCYHPGQNGIYIYNVQDSTLAGIQQVTAAHEVLHAVYERLSSSDRNRLDSELESFYKTDLTDPTVKGEVALYQKTEPTDVDDEMSCTFGTEVTSLPAPLEQYYAKYFGNRQKIVGYYSQYQAQFSSRQQQIAADDSQLASMKSQIGNLQDSLAAENKTIADQKTQLQQLLATDQPAAYNAQVNGYNTEIDSYNTQIDSLKQQITTYNQLVDTRNALAGQLTTLAQAIDTRVPSTVTK